MKSKLATLSLIFVAAALLWGPLPQAILPDGCNAETTTSYSQPRPTPASDELTATLVNPATEAKTGQLVIFDLDTNTTVVTWKCLPDDANARTFRGMIEYKGQGPDGKPVLGHLGLFSANQAGIYYIVIACTKDNQQVLVTHSIKVTGNGPSPDPGPDPNPNPTPGRRALLVIRESKTLTAAQAQVIQALRLYARTKTHTFQEEDPDLMDRNKKQPAWLQEFLAKAAKEGIAPPVLAVGSFDDGGKVVGVKIESLPTKPEDALEFVKKQGG